MKGQFLAQTVNKYEKGEEIVFVAINSDGNQLYPCSNFAFQLGTASESLGKIIPGKVYEVSFDEVV